ncbi:MAG: hypothetical protein AB1646_21445 [Thermodesulfobacteriota bacterium]
MDSAEIRGFHLTVGIVYDRVSAEFGARSEEPQPHEYRHRQTRGESVAAGGGGTLACVRHRGGTGVSPVREE